MKQLLLCMAILVLFTGCGKKEAKIYTAEAAEESHGYRDTLTVTFEGDTVTEAHFESYRADGGKKSETTQEEYPMTPRPAEWMPKLSEQVEKARTPDEIEGIAGATYASKNARKLYAAILKGHAEGADTAKKFIVETE